MALYDDAKIMFLASGAARTDTAQGTAQTTGSGSGGIFSKAQCIKPVEVLTSTELLQNTDFSTDGGGTGGALENTVYGAWGWNHTDAQGNDASSKITGGVLTLSNGTDGDAFAYATTSSNNRNILTENATYKLTYTITASKITQPEGNHSLVGYWDGQYKDIPQTVGTHTAVMVHTTAGSNKLFLFRLKGDNDEVSIDNISIKKLTTAPMSFDMTRDDNLDATRVGPSGLIEKGRENLVHYSNNFSTANGGGGWGHSGINTISTGQDGYDGTTNATLIRASAPSQKHQITLGVAQSLPGTDFSITGVFTLSVHAKPSGYDHLILRSDVNNIDASFNIATGVVGTKGSKCIASSMTDVGNGFYRCQATFHHSGSVEFLAIGMMEQDDTTDFAGSTSKGFILQDAQLEMGLTATELIPTSGNAGTAGIKEDEPRFDYPPFGGAPSLLVEPLRKNEIKQSEYISADSSNWFEGRVNTASHQTTSPEGLDNATKVTATVQASSNTKRIYSNTWSVADDEVWTASVFLKANTANKIEVRITSSTEAEIGFGQARFTADGDGTAEFDSNNQGDSVTITKLRNGWYRCTATGTLDSSLSGWTGTARMFIYVMDPDTGARAYVSDGTESVFLYGAQAEKGSNSANATSYIPTYGTAATRSADVLPEVTHGITLGTAVTVLLEARVFGGGGQISILQLRLNDSNRFIFFTGSSAADATHDINVQHRESGNNLAIQKTGLTRGDIFKCIGRVDGTTFNMFVNGVKMGTTKTVVATDVYDKISLIRNGTTTNQSGHKTKSVVVWDSALTDQQCIDLTTL